MNKKLKKIISWVLTFIIMFIICVPGIWVLISAFRPNPEILSKPANWWPDVWTLEQFAQMFSIKGYVSVPAFQYLMNSIVISLTSTVIAITIGMMGGYAFARFNFKGKNAIFLGLMLARAVPGISLSLPLFILWAKLGLINTSFGVILVYVAMNVPFTIWLTDGFFRQIPKEMSEVARTDGCTRFQAFWNVELPLAGPGIAAAGIFAFLLSWNEYALASVLTRTMQSKTLPIGMMDYLSEFTINWAGMCAIAVVMIIPAVILTFIVQKHLVSGLTFGGVKG
jgi:multiple sugar transport system permease protein